VLISLWLSLCVFEGRRTVKLLGFTDYRICSSTVVGYSTEAEGLCFKIRVVIRFSTPTL